MQEPSVKQLKMSKANEKNKKAREVKKQKKAPDVENQKARLEEEGRRKTDRIPEKNYSFWNKPMASPTPQRKLERWYRREIICHFPIISLCQDLLKQDPLKFCLPMKRWQ